VTDQTTPNTDTSWDYAPAPESLNVQIADQYGLFINGQFVEGHSNQAEPTINPSNENALSQITQADEEDVNAAVLAARNALEPWSTLPPLERAKYLYRIARRIQERSLELAVLETMDGGKPIREARDLDLPLAAQHFFYYAGWADKLKYAFAGMQPKPVGVCAQIIPWNFPLLMAAWKIAPALACGNTVVLKPAETTPLTALRLAEIFQDIDLPPGVVNIITGDGQTGASLASHPDINKIAFTGSTGVGKQLAEVAAQRGLPITLELGGKSPNIIFEDASIDQAVEGIIQGIYLNQGHVCCAGSRLFVQESIVDEVVQKLDWRLKSLRVGDPLDKNTDVGAINSAEQLARIQSYFDKGTQQGAIHHEVQTEPLPEKGYWCRPCYFTKVQPNHTIAREEIFGPVLVVMTFRTPKEAITRANNTPYGLAAGIWTEQGSKAIAVANQLKAGVVWCNTYNRFDPASPFGGYKESGFGREGGRQGLRPYIRING